MAMNVSKKSKKTIDPEVFTGGGVPKRNNPPTPPGIGGGMSTSKKSKGTGIDPDAFTNATPKRSSPPAPSKS
jgi:hypothetical protein